ncbi:MAG: transporter, partial [Bacteroidales bacterium]
NEVIACGQSLGQKNTILAIWLTHTYINPMVAIAPASYVLWQNCINSYQLWKKRRN